MSTYPTDDENCLEYDDARGEYRATCKCPPSQCVVKATAMAADTPVSDLPPLYPTVDGEALDDLLDSAESTATDVSVTFTFHGHEVTVDSAGDITVRPIAEERPPVG